MPRLKPVRGLQVNLTHPLARALVGCWLLNEGTGNRVMDLGPFRQHGDFQGGPPLWKPGRHGPSVEFDGIDECIHCGTRKFGWDVTNKVSVIALANHGASANPYTIFGRGQFREPVSLMGQSPGLFYWRVRTTESGVKSLTSTSSHATDGTEWVHVAGTWKQNASRLYVNGVEEASDLTVSGTLSVTDDQSAGIGGIYQGGSYSNIWIGRIGYVLIYNRALGPSEVEWLSREPFAMFEYPGRSAFAVAVGASVSLAGSVDSTSAASARLRSIGWAPEIEQKWRLDALFNGMTANALKLGTTLTLGWFWVRVGGCSALYRGPRMEGIDFESILAVAEKNAPEISPPAYLPHNDLSTYFYAVRQFNPCGYQELTLSAAAKVSLNAQGELARPQPNEVFALSAERRDGNRIRLTWFYCPLEQQSQPARFNIYCDNGAGQIDYDNPIGAVGYEGQRFYTYESDTLQTGRYLFAVRAEDLAGSENVSVDCLAIEISGAAPDAITILEAGTA
ncbi:MAG TPA: LamG domain-containing protein [Sedimentisphaerales bacterium]|nr:LamG domain-containing protein [Sedimentisphaerales bacterium]